MYYAVTATYLTRKPSVSDTKYRRCNLLSKADLFHLRDLAFVILYSSVISGENKVEKNVEMVRNAISFVII